MSKSYFAFLLLSEAGVSFFFELKMLEMPLLTLEVVVPGLFLRLASDSDIKASYSCSDDSFNVGTLIPYLFSGIAPIICVVP